MAWYETAKGSVETPRGASLRRRDPAESKDVPRGLSTAQAVFPDPETPHGASLHWERPAVEEDERRPELSSGS